MSLRWDISQPSILASEEGSSPCAAICNDMARDLDDWSLKQNTAAGPATIPR